ncbi:MAG: hypothetical protein RLZZ455_848 [Candidatus Parcubacteria bacterium]|jgi:UDP-N-acetylmuramyl pentapeptide synthase
MRKYLTLIVLMYLRFFARKALARHKPTIIGIAGSVGKSSTAHMLFSVLSLQEKTSLIGNSETGIPLGILGLQPTTYTLFDWIRLLINAPRGIDHLKNTKYLITEMGIDDPFPPKNMGYLLTILKPEIAIALNESATHSQQFEKALQHKNLPQSEEERLKEIESIIAKEDCRIITESGCKVAIYNADDENITHIINENQTSTLKKTQCISFGNDPSRNLSYKRYEITTSHSIFSLRAETSQWDDQEIEIAFPGMLLPKAYMQSIAAVIAASLSLSIPKETIKKGIESFSLPHGRATLLTGINNTKIIDSSYNSSKAAVYTFLEMIHALKKETKRPIIFLFGDMRELGEEAKIEHEQVAEKLQGIVDHLFLVGPLTKQYVLPLFPEAPGSYGLKEIRWFTNARYAGEYMKDSLPQNAIVLVKGSQNTIFLEEAVKYILADKKDAKKLCRQTSFWVKLKNDQGILGS